MGSKKLQTREIQKARFVRQLDTRKSVLKEKGCTRRETTPRSSGQAYQGKAQTDRQGRGQNHVPGQTDQGTP